MREGWESVLLRDVITLHYGKPMRDVDRVAGDVPVVGSAGIFGWHSEPNVKTRSSIIVGRKGTAGSVTWFDGRVWATDTSYWVEPKIESSLEFIYLLLQNADLPGMTAQTGVPGLNRDRAYSASVLLPPLEEQQRIVDLIGSLDDAIEAADSVADATRQSMEGLRKHALTAASTASSSLADFVEFASGYSFPLSFQGATSGDYPFYKVSDMNAPGNEHKMTVAKNWITEQDKQQIRCRVWPAGTVIFPKVGAALATEKRRMLDRPAVFDNNLMGLVAGPLLSPGYLFIFMEEVVLGAVAQVGPVPSINQSHIKSLKIAVPPLEEQLAAVEMVDQARDAVGRAESYTASLRAARAELLGVLLSGDHEIPESYDIDTAVQLEPAA